MQTTTLHPDIRLTPGPVSTPEKFRSGHCHLELTPVWQYVIKKNRFPANVDRQEVFSELAIRLQHPEWQVRLHGSRVLAYIVPAVGPHLDTLMSPTILPLVITNLAHFSPALRSSSMDAILIYVQHSSDPEYVLKSMIIQGLDVSGAKSSLTVNVMECVPVVLQQIVKRNGDRPIAIPTFVHLVTALSNKMIQATFQQAAVYCLDRVKEIVGRNKFDHYLETFHPIIKKDFEVLCEVYRISSSSGRDSSISSYDDEDDVEISKTPRRVTFGGELIKIRSPDVSDDPEVIRPTSIPIPIKPALNKPKHPKDENKATRLSIPRQTELRRTRNYFYDKRTINQVFPKTLPPLRQSNFKQFSSGQIGPCLGTPFRRKVMDRISFNKGLFSPHTILCTGRTNGSFDRNHKNTKSMKMDRSDKDFAKAPWFSPRRRRLRQPSPLSHRKDLPAAADTESSIKRQYRFHNSVLRNKLRNKNRGKKISLNHTMFVVPKNVSPSCTPAIINIESSLRTTLSMTMVPEVRTEHKFQSSAGTDVSTKEDNYDDMNRTQQPSSNSSNSNNSHNDIVSESSMNIPIEKFDDAAILETRYINQSKVDERNKPSANSVINQNNNNIQLNFTATIQSKNDKPVAQVKPTTATMQQLQLPAERKSSVARMYPKKPEKRPNEIGTNFTPFNEPQRALQLTATQINSPEWEAAVTGLQNISRLSMFHGKELRPNSLQPFVRTVAKHIKSLRSQVSRAACTAVQKMFTYVPKSVEPDIEVIASALFPRTADTNKFLRVQSADALNAMVDNVNPIKCVHVITSKGIKHGNRLVRAEACRLLARVVDKLGVGGTLHLPVDVRDAVITSATNMVFDNTPTSRQAAQHILSKLSEDPRGAALISSAASPNVKVTLNKSLSRIFLK